MAEKTPSISEPESDFIELAMEMALLERTSKSPDAFSTAESILREAVEFRKSHRE